MRDEEETRIRLFYDHVRSLAENPRLAALPSSPNSTFVVRRKPSVLSDNSEQTIRQAQTDNLPCEASQGPRPVPPVYQPLHLDLDFASWPATSPSTTT